MITCRLNPLLRLIICSLLVIFCHSPALQAEEEYTFEIEEFEKKILDWGGYAELKWDHIDLNEDGALTRLKFYDDPRAKLDRLTGTLQLNGSLTKGISTFKWVLQASGQQDHEGWDDEADVFEAYAGIKMNPNATFDLGKKVTKWGKGYAWNPVGFIQRPKDPNNPEESLEGFTVAGLDLVKSLSGPLRTAALTTVVLPVLNDVNEDFGEKGHLNLAAKLYLLYRDTDIDFVWYTGNSRSTRYGVDFAKNISTNFEIHGELAYFPNLRQKYLDADDNVVSRNVDALSYLLGLRYLTRNDITSIVEFYHNGAGFSEEEMQNFFQLAHDGYNQFLASGSATLLQKAVNVSRIGYSRPQPARNYLYTRIIQKEPFDILYFTPGLTAIINLDDQSYSITPEIVYTGLTNWEVRLRFSFINGGYLTEHGEKQNSNKLELRLRYFF